MTRTLPALVLLVVCLGLVVCRWSALDFPLFWDELGVYGPSVFYLLENGVDIQPKALDPELSRGHPMLYVFVNALVGSLFGASGIVLHSFNLIIACLVLLSTYALGKKVVDAPTGLMAAAILGVQPLFHAQATLILPEMALTLAAMGMLYGYLVRIPWLYLISGICAVWLKETAIFIPVAFMVHWLVMLRLKQGHTTESRSWPQFMLLGLPWIAFGAFLLIQKAQNGWFLFPYHTGLFDFSPLEVVRKFSRFLKFLLFDQGRMVWGAVLLASLISVLFKKPSSWKLISWKRFMDHPHGELYLCFSLYGLLLMGFSSTNAYLNRYLLLLFPPLAIVVAHQFRNLSVRTLRHWPAIQRYYAIPSMLLIAFLFLGLPWVMPVRKFPYDEHPAFKHHLALTQMAVDELMLNAAYKGTRVQCNWPIHTALEEENAGFRKGILPFYLLGPRDSLDYYVWLDPGNYSHPPPLDLCEVHKVFKYHGMSCTIYRRR